MARKEGKEKNEGVSGDTACIELITEFFHSPAAWLWLAFLRLIPTIFALSSVSLLDEHTCNYRYRYWNALLSVKRDLPKEETDAKIKRSASKWLQSELKLAFPHPVLRAEFRRSCLLSLLRAIGEISSFLITDLVKATF